MGAYFVSFPHISTIDALPEVLLGYGEHHPEVKEITYRGSIKLHGTNVGIVVYPDGSLGSQGRNRDTFAKGGDAYNFTETVTRGKTVTDILPEHPSPGKHVTIYGEYVGPRVQKKVACSLLPERRFVAFALRIEDGPLLDAPMLLPPLDNVMQIEETITLRLDLSNYKEEMSRAVGLVKAVDAECPWSKARGVLGPGEGIVWRTPISSRLWWKVKGKSHKAGTKVPPTPEQRAARSLAEKVALAVYSKVDGPTRVAQGIEILSPFHSIVGQSHTGEFLKWFGPDFSRECGAVVSAASKETGVDARVIRKKVMAHAVKEFHAMTELVHQGDDEDA